MLGPRREPFFLSNAPALCWNLNSHNCIFMLIYINHGKINYCKEIIYLLTLTDLFVLNFELNEAKVCAVFVVNELRVLSNQIYIIQLYISCVYTCNMLGVHKFRANILTTCKGHHNPTLLCNYFFQNSLPVISYRLFNVFSKIFFLLQT